MKITVKNLATHLGGELIGDGEVELKGVGRIESASRGSVTFLGNLKYEEYLYKSKASAVIINRGFSPSKEVVSSLIVVEDAYKAIATTLQLFNSLKSRKRRGHAFSAKFSLRSSIAKGVYIGEHAVIEKRVKIGEGSQVYPGVFIGEGSQIGENVILYPGVKIYHETVVGSNTIIHANAVIGADGFGFMKNPDGSYQKIPQLGNVVIGSDCEIGANTTIDRATSGSTIIGNGVKLDNLIQVAHNCTIGDNTVVAAQTGLAGSVKLGEGCTIAGQVGFAGHLSIANNSIIGAQSGVISSVKEEGKTLLGSPAIDARDFLKAYSIFRKLHKR